MCFCGDSREGIDARQVRFIHDHLPDYETQRQKYVMTYENEDRARWEAAEADKQQRRKQLERAISRPKATHHRDRNGYWVKNTREHQMAPFESVKRKPVAAAGPAKRSGNNDGLDRRGDGAVVGVKTSSQGDRDGRREEIAGMTRAAIEAQAPF